MPGAIDVDTISKRSRSMSSESTQRLLVASSTWRRSVGLVSLIERRLRDQQQLGLQREDLGSDSRRVADPAV